MTKEENLIGYQFAPVPTNLIFMLDPSCFKLMSLLIQEESYQKAKNNVKDKCFPEAIKRLSLRIPMCEKDVKLTIKSLEEANLIEVFEQGVTSIDKCSEIGIGSAVKMASRVQ